MRAQTHRDGSCHVMPTAVALRRCKPLISKVHRFLDESCSSVENVLDTRGLCQFATYMLKTTIAQTWPRRSKNHRQKLDGGTQPSEFCSVFQSMAVNRECPA